MKRFKKVACAYTLSSIPESGSLTCDNEKLAPFIEAINKELAAGRITEPGIYHIVFLAKVPFVNIFKYSCTKVG